MRYLLILLTLATSLSCTKTSNPDQTNLDKSDTLTTVDNVTLDSLDFHILKFDTTMRIFPPTFKPADLSKKEIIKCEILLKAFIDGYNRKGTERFGEMTKKHGDGFDIKSFTIELNECGRQFVCAKSDNGEKFVYVNCFCNPKRFGYRDKELVWVFDGGNCYFNFKINLTTNQLFDFMENGVA